jgi:hypothetical protein
MDETTNMTYVGDWNHETGEQVEQEPPVQPNPNGQEPAQPEPALRLSVTQERMNRLKVGTIRKSQTGDVGALFDYIAHFMVDDQGRHLNREAAFALLDEVEIGQLQTVGEQLNALAQESAAPKK